MSNAETPEHVDPSAPAKYSFEWWEARSDRGRCRAHRKNGDRCKRPHDPGATVCGHHGARAPAVKRKARQRLEEAADRMARELLGIATSDEVSDAVKLAAIKDALDRAGLKPPSQAEITLAASGPKPWEQMIAGMATGTRAESRAARGIQELGAGAGDVARRWDRNTVEVAEGEVVDVRTVPYAGAMPSTFVGDDLPRPNGDAGPDRPAQPATDQTAGTELMTLEEANEYLARVQRGT